MYCKLVLCTPVLYRMSQFKLILQNVPEMISSFFSIFKSSRHPCIPPTTPVLYHELSQSNIIGLICGKSQKKAVKSNLGKFLREYNFNFFNAKKLPIFADFEPFFTSQSILLTFVIELMLPNDGQILVDPFKHQNFGIWTFLV